MTKNINSQASVILIPHGFQPAYERGFSNGLAHTGVKVTLVGSDWTDTARIDTRVEVLNLRGSQDGSRSTVEKTLNLLRYHLRLLRLVFSRRSSVIHVIGLFRYPVLMGLLEAFFFGIFSRRYVLTVHNLLPHDCHSALNFQIYRRIYRIPDLLVVHTQSMKEGLCKSFHVPEEKVIVMEHGCEIEFPGRANAVPITGAQQIDRSDRSFTLLFFGNIAPYKGLDVLLQAFEGLGHEFKLNIVGVCRNAEYGGYIRELITRSPARGCIKWCDRFVTEEEMWEAFSTASAVILPYRHIDQSGVLFQALCFGLPVVAARVGEFERYVSKDFGEVFAPADFSELKLAIQRVYQRRHEFSRKKIIARAQQLDWRKTVSVLQSAYS